MVCMANVPCDKWSVWQMISVTNDLYDNPFLFLFVWQPVYVTTCSCDNLFVWQLVCVTTFLCDNLFVWQSVCVTICICDSPFVKQRVCTVNTLVPIVNRPEWPSYSGSTYLPHFHIFTDGDDDTYLFLILPNLNKSNGLILNLCHRKHLRRCN